jgi:rare lipoprotein A
VRIGPFGNVAEADAALDRALRAGVSDARIVVDDQ